jgi:hypothetical protein
MTDAISAPPAAITDAQLAALGITRIPADVFEVGGYRYSNATDAVAAAARLSRTANDA